MKILQVLQIEDCEGDAALIERSLEKAGYQIDCKRVETAEEMHRALRQQPWDLIIADYHLPQFDAETALKILQSSGRDVPFIVVSGMVGEDVAVDMMKRGAHDYVMKGNLARLAPAVQREIKEARTRELRALAEAALHKSEREFRELAESIPQLVWITSGQAETIYCNTRCQQQLGVGPNQPLRDQWAELLHPEDRDPCLTAWNECLKDAKEFQRECRFRMVSGEFRWFLLRAIPVKDERGSVTRWFGTSTDIDEQKQVQQKLIKANAELGRSNSMLEQFAYVASHDLQEPLRSVAVFIQMLTLHCEGQLDATAKEYFQIVRDGTLRMKRLIGDLLTFSRAGREDRALLPTNLDDVLDEALKNLKARVEETGATVTRSALPVPLADFGQFVQLFQNLIANALKYRKDKVPPVIGISARQEQDCWVIAVRDNGIGINPRYLERIFGLFKRLHTQEKYDGTGIGLAICERIAERHKSRLWVESAEGAGATFYLAIPNAGSTTAMSPGE